MYGTDWLNGQLLGATVQQADMRVGTHHGFAVHFQDQAQYAVRRRMLRAEVHRVIADFLLAFHRIAREGIGCLAVLTHLAVSDLPTSPAAVS